VIAAFFVGLVILEATTSPTVEAPERHAALGVPAMAALAFRRHFPILVSLVVVLVNPLINPEAEYTVSLSIALLGYTIGRECGAPRAQLGLALLVATFLGLLVAADGGLVPSDLAAAGVLVGGTWTVGQVVRQRAQVADEARERALQLEREQDLRAAAAAAQERVRLARELHDVVTHSISILAIQSQAVRRRLRPDQQREIKDLDAMETTAREAMTELRRLFGVLRSQDEPPDRAPQPGLADLDRLADNVRATGLAVHLTRAGGADPLPPGVDLTAFRIVQEALTNALKHAEASAVFVRIDRSRSFIDLVVEDDGLGLNGRSSGGNGILGVKERAALYGGELRVDSSPHGGVRVSVRLPAAAR